MRFSIVNRFLPGLALVGVTAIGGVACTGVSTAPASPEPSRASTAIGRSALTPGKSDRLGLLVEGVLAGRTSPWSEAGQNVPTDDINMLPGARHCDWQSVIFLNVGWPLGTPDRSMKSAKAREKNVRQFVRDPSGHLEPVTTGMLALRATMPSDAANTGYLNAGVHLWLAASDPDGAYLTDGDSVERWPRATSFIACA